MKQLIRTVILASALIVGSVAMAEDAKTANTQSAHQRGGMGHMREAMQACLSSGKAMPDCRQEMMKNHAGGMGQGSCPMMDHMDQDRDSGQEG